MVSPLCSSTTDTARDSGHASKSAPQRLDLQAVEAKAYDLRRETKPSLPKPPL
ncbi:hypothetical protein HSR122_1377 [Halapricum desulfuricans]|uniref:Uncharacterized protein n=1 Tax=Halapricum desulfuricans TaxID=2841257 RepID=A0A897NCI2_9EURY|nr:hypothetical protein HSR122_1377 [Halapricum desulfuricans]